MGPAHTVWDMMADGTLELVKGTLPPPLCEACPAREDNPIRLVKIIRSYGWGDE